MVVGEGKMLCMFDPKMIKRLKHAQMKEFPDGRLWVIDPNGQQIGIVAELELTQSDYDKREELALFKFRVSSTQSMKSGYMNPEGIPVYAFIIMD